MRRNMDRNNNEFTEEEHRAMGRVIRSMRKNLHESMLRIAQVYPDSEARTACTTTIETLDMLRATMDSHWKREMGPHDEYNGVYYGFESKHY